MKRSLLAEATGGPLAVVISGANTHDTKLLSATLAAVIVERPQPTEEKPQHLCLDKGYDTISRSIINVCQRESKSKRT